MLGTGRVTQLLPIILHKSLMLGTKIDLCTSEIPDSSAFCALVFPISPDKGNLPKKIQLITDIINSKYAKKESELGLVSILSPTSEIYIINPNYDGEIDSHFLSSYRNLKSELGKMGTF